MIQQQKKITQMGLHQPIKLCTDKETLIEGSDNGQNGRKYFQFMYLIVG
jgi:hypothetical protein